LVCQLGNDNVLYQAGIARNIYKNPLNNQVSFTGTYTDLSAYREWIDETVNEEIPGGSKYYDSSFIRDERSFDESDMRSSLVNQF
jgi:hypothetical protein